MRSSLRGAGAAAVRRLRRTGEQMGDALGSAAGRLKESDTGERLNAALEVRRVIRRAEDAHARGNPAMAWRLLEEEVRARPRDDKLAIAFWRTCVAMERGPEAADGLLRVIRARAAEGQLDEAASLWCELVDVVPFARPDASVLVRIAPTFLESAPERAVQALRASLHPEAPGLTAGLAMRVVDLARELDPPAALGAARVALQSPDLVDAKRAKLEQQVASLEREVARAARERAEAGEQGGSADDEIPVAPQRAASVQQAPRELRTPRPEPRAPEPEEPLPDDLLDALDSPRTQPGLDDSAPPFLDDGLDLSGEADATELESDEPFAQTELESSDEPFAEAEPESSDEPFGETELESSAEPFAETELESSDEAFAQTELEASDEPFAQTELEAEPFARDGLDLSGASHEERDDAGSGEPAEAALGAGEEPFAEAGLDLSSESVGDMDLDESEVAFAEPDLDESEVAFAEPDLDESEVAFAGSDLDESEVAFAGSDLDESEVAFAERVPEPDASAEPFAETELEGSEAPFAVEVEEDLGPAPTEVTVEAGAAGPFAEDAAEPTVAPIAPAPAPPIAPVVVEEVSEPFAELVVEPEDEGLAGIVAETVDAFAPATRFSGVKVMEGTPLGIDDASIELSVSGGRRARLEYTSLQAIAAAEVEGLAAEPVVLVDLALNWSDDDDEMLRVVRLRTDRFEEGPLEGGDLQVVRSFLASLLSRSEAVPLPGRQAALGDPFQRYVDLDTYQREVLQAG